mmetsp:Transcript_63556/g.185823  ORF Transcript_63556/g.185823 Transcript_63556/m.185823 type:complete len:476 (+) Transcript_63556:77-1504(+)
MPHAVVVSSLPATPRSQSGGKAADFALQQPSSEALRAVVLAANSDGIHLLRRGRAAAAFEQLKYAEAVLAANPEASAQETDLLALTCSNLGCYYRKAGLPRAALRYLGRALKMEETFTGETAQDTRSLATTKLNACAALSGLGSHEEAERLAMEATRLLVAQAPSESSRPPSQEESALLAVACHNLGAEREHLGRWASAAVAFRQGAEVAERALGPHSDLARALSTSCGEALGRAEKHPSTPDRPSMSRPRGAAPKRPWLRHAGFVATGGAVAKSSPRRVPARSIRSAPPLLPKPPSPIDLSDWGVAPPMTGGEPVGGGAEAVVAMDRRPGSRQGTLASTAEFAQLEGEEEQELPSIMSRSPGGSFAPVGLAEPGVQPPAIDREHSSEDWGDLPSARSLEGGNWRGAGRVRVMSPESSRGASGHSVPTSVAASPRQSLSLEAPTSKPPGGLSARRREHSSAAHAGLHAGAYRSSG